MCAPGTGSCSPHSNLPPTIDNIQDNGDGDKPLLRAKQMESYQTKLDTWVEDALKRWDADVLFKISRRKKYKMDDLTKESFEKLLKIKASQSFNGAVRIQESIKALNQQEKVQKIVAGYETQLSTWLLKKLKKF